MSGLQLEVRGATLPAARREAPVQREAPVGRGERGMVSAEWAVGILAAIALAGVLVGVVTDGAVSDAILKFLLWVIRTFSGWAADQP